MIKFDVALPPSLTVFGPAAVARLGYLFPAAIFRLEGDRIFVEANETCDVAQLRSEILHTVYREKIFENTLEIRRRLLVAVTSP